MVFLFRWGATTLGVGGEACCLAVDWLLGSGQAETGPGVAATGQALSGSITGRLFTCSASKLQETETQM